MSEYIRSICVRFGEKLTWGKGDVYNIVDYYRATLVFIIHEMVFCLVLVVRGRQSGILSVW